jgi:2-dehydro-3-deoxyglucarate aldolase
MRPNLVRDKIKKGEASIGCFLGLGSPTVAELMARAGFEWLVIETEHNGLDSAEIQNMLMALNGSSTIPLVRIPSLNSDYIQRALDIGAMGIVVPMIRTADDIRKFIKATRFPPEGTRSFGPLRASNYMFDANDYFLHANSNILTMAIMETKEAVQNLAEIAAVPGLDAIIIGPYDLCLSLGLDPMKMPHPEVEAIVKRVLEEGARNNVGIATHALTPDEVIQKRAEGFKMISYAMDYYLLARSAREGVDAFANRKTDWQFIHESGDEN